MVLYIDPPRWPAHGTVFSHLISDRSYTELHEFAQSIGLSRRAFDGDHYDVPAELYDDAVRAGARPISGADLVRRLRHSELRIPARERAEKILPVLRGKWAVLWPEKPALGEELLRRWSEPHRHYHTTVHLLECLDAIELLADKELGAPPPREVLLAAWFHDAIYEGKAGDDEERSAELAQDALGGGLGQEVARLVLLTRDHSAQADDLAGQLLVDADLSILAAPRARYRRYVAQIREEYAHVSETQWPQGRLSVLETFLDRRDLFSVPAAKQMWCENAARNLAWEIGELQHA